MGGSHKVVDWPIFPSYVFCRFREADVTRVLRTAGVVTVLGSGDRLATIPDEEIGNVRRFVEAVVRGGQEPEPVSRRDFREGQRVRVTVGPFEGVEGTVRETRDRHRLLAGITGIGQALEVDITADSVEPTG